MGFLGPPKRHVRGFPRPLFFVRDGRRERTGGSDVAMAAVTEEDLLLRSFMAEVSGVERDNEVAR